MGILTHELIHLVLATLVAVFFVHRFKNWLLVIPIFFTGFFLDLDHLFDYFIFTGLKFNLDNFIHARYFCSSGHLFLPLHAWEWPIILLILSRFRILTPWLLALAAGISVHLIFDQLSNHMYPLGYSIIFRVINGFQIDQIVYDCIKG